MLEKEACPLWVRLEALLFAAPEPLSFGEIFNKFPGVSSGEIQGGLEQIKAFYDQRKGGFSLLGGEGQGDYRFETTLRVEAFLEGVFSQRPRQLSRAAQETLAIVAYKQPITRAHIEFIRGVDGGNIIKNLMDRELIRCVGRKEDAGRPMLFGTTEKFLQVYGLASLEALPPLLSFQPSGEVLGAAWERLNSQAEGKELGDIVL